MKYKVVRTSTDSYEELQEAFDNGWQYKSCHQCQCKERADRYTYQLVNCLEYILVKKENTDESK